MNEELVNELPSLAVFLLKVFVIMFLTFAAASAKAVYQYWRFGRDKQSGTITAMFCLILLISLFGILGTFDYGYKQASIAASTRNVIRKFSIAPIHIEIDGVASASPREIQKILLAFDEIKNRKSHQSDVYTLSISNDTDTIDLVIGRDSRVHDEYWLFRKTGEGIERVGTVHSSRLTELIKEALD